MRCTPVVLALLASSLSAAAQHAPVGLSWGPVDQTPKPSRAHHEGNVTSLSNDHGRPIAAGDCTER